MTTQSNPDVLRGTLDLLILKTLTLDDMHGWGIGQRIQQCPPARFGNRFEDVHVR